MLRTKVAPAHAGLRLGDWLTLRFSYHDRQQWLVEVAAGRVLRNGTLAAAEDVLQAGDVVAYAPLPAPPDTVPVVTLLHVDAHFVVLDKPPHLAAHLHGAFARHTLLPALTAAMAARGESAAGLEPAHRLDRDTSGVLLLSRTLVARRGFERQFAAGTVAKEYLAVAAGALAADSGSIELAIAKAPASALPFRRAVVGVAVPGARAARTDFAVVERLPSATVLRLWPCTGRTHQIRVHLEALGHPLVGDKLYGRTDADYAAYVRHLEQGGAPAFPGVGGALRHLLHACRLAFQHPATGETVAVTAPVPRDMDAWIAAARPRCDRQLGGTPTVAT